MATEQIVSNISLVAAGDLSTKQFYAMKVSGVRTVTTNDTAGGPVIGFLQNKPDAAGKAAQIAVAGVTKATAGGSVSAGDRLKSDANGKLVAASAGTTDTSDGGAAADPLVGSNVVGIALTAGSDGTVIEVLIVHSGAIPTTAA